MLAACAWAIAAAGTARAGGGAATRIVVAATRRSSRASLFAVTSSGTLKPLGRTGPEQTQPALSPSGTRLAYVQAGRAKCYECPLSIWISNSDGAGARILTPPLPGTVSYDGSPSFSPNGARIVFSRQTDVSYSLYVTSVSGGTPRSLFVPGVSPSWGPSRIAYLSPPTQAPGPVTLWTIDSNGAAPKQITTGYIVTPDWSSNGSLAFLDQPPDAGPTLVVLTGVTLHRYPLPFVQAKALAWAPDGAHLAVVAQTKRSGPFDVYTVGADGKGIRRLTVGAGAVGVAWSR